MKGQGLIESLLALSLMAIVLSGISVALISSLSNASFGSDQAIATQYAQEGVELVRKVRNSNYSAFQGYNGSYCLAKGSTVLEPSGNCATPNVDKYIRTVVIEQSPGCGLNTAKVTAVVSWVDGRCPTGNYCHKSNIISCLSTVNPIIAP
jgi:hypothetical protein